MKYEIEIPDLPEGWEPVAYRPATYGERYLLDLRPETNCFGKTNSPVLIVQEKQPRRIVLEEVNHLDAKIAFEYNNAWSYWKIVEDTNARNN